GYRVPERSVATGWVADRFVAALSAETGIAQQMATRVTSVRPQTAQETDGRWFVETEDGRHGPYDFIINSLWEGRLAVDLTAGLKPEGNWSNRYRLALFIRTDRPLEVPSAIITTGPFGDIKNYNSRDFYLSWYPKGLIADSNAISPPALTTLSPDRTREISHSVLDSLEALLPETARIRAGIEQMTVAGGWVYAAGRGALSDPNSTLHRRSDYGIARLGAYLSIDTGKYSTAPWLAHQVADSIMPVAA
ncbi:MAG: hypothetical protein PHX10_08200, partial [Gallionellaceae bacterium]|nr:hypothetical protein [Gallionellaceae bacterium]